MALHYIRSNPRYTPPPSPSSQLAGAMRYVRGSARGAALAGLVGGRRAGTAATLQGVEMVLRDFIGLEQQGRRRAAIGLRRAALQLLRDSKKLVPVDTGALRASGQISDRYVDRTAPGALVLPPGGTFAQYTMTVYVVYTVYYALFVHEATWVARRHGKRAKFVEIPLRMNRFVYILIIQNSINQINPVGGAAGSVQII